jgi:hypothetical protein
MLYQTLVIIHLIGFALGLGSATVSDYLLFKFLKDYKISSWEKNILEKVSLLVWIGLFIQIVSGIGFYSLNYEVLNHTVKFLVKVVAVGIITLNGILLHKFVMPRMMKLNFGDSKITFIERLSFASGAISVTSWWFATIMGALRNDISFTFLQLLGIYLALILCAIISSQILTYFISIGLFKSNKLKL